MRLKKQSEWNFSSCAGPHVLPLEAEGSAEVVGVPLAYLDALSSVRIYLPKDLRTAHSRKTALLAVEEASKRLQQVSGSIPLLDTIEDMKVGFDVAPYSLRAFLWGMI